MTTTEGTMATKVIRHSTKSKKFPGERLGSIPKKARADDSSLAQLADQAIAGLPQESGTSSLAADLSDLVDGTSDTGSCSPEGAGARGAPEGLEKAMLMYMRSMDARMEKSFASSQKEMEKSLAAAFAKVETRRRQTSQNTFNNVRNQG